MREISGNNGTDVGARVEVPIHRPTLARKINTFVDRSFRGKKPPKPQSDVVSIIGSSRGQKVSGIIPFDIPHFTFTGSDVQVTVTRAKDWDGGTTLRVDIEPNDEVLVISREGSYIEARGRDYSRPVLVGGRIPHDRRRVLSADHADYQTVVAALSSRKVEKTAEYFPVTPPYLL